jgi:hypothetical protein
VKEMSAEWILGIILFIAFLLTVYYEYFARNYIENILVLDKYEYGYKEGQYKVRCLVNRIITTVYVYNPKLYWNLEINQEYKVKMRKISDKFVIVSIIRE